MYKYIYIYMYKYIYIYICIYLQVIPIPAQKRSFSLRTFSVNVTKYAVSRGLVTFT